MKHVLSVVTFVMAATCFAMLLVTVKPATHDAVTTPNKPAHCKMAVSREAVCRSEPERLER